jgi:sugar lactone lactonase YvrE
MPTARLVLDAKNIVGESIVWSAADEALYWVDIGGRSIHRLDPAKGRHDSWKTPDLPTSIGLCEGGGFIVGLRCEVALWKPGEPFRTLAVPEPELPDNRLNEGRVAPDGSFWVGTMQNNLEADGSPRAMDRDSGAIYRIGADGSVHRLTADAFGITNTMVWLNDGRFVTADTTKNALYAYDFDPSTGALRDRRGFGTVIDRGLPDGSCLDAEGFVWNCRVVGGAALARIAPDGRLDRLVELPCTWPTSCTFGGRDLATLYVTSARFTMTDEHLSGHPLEGGLFALDAGVAGTPEHLFRL